MNNLEVYVKLCSALCQSQKWSPFCSIIMVGFSETLVNFYQSTWHYTPEECHWYVKSRISSTLVETVCMCISETKCQQQLQEILYFCELKVHFFFTFFQTENWGVLYSRCYFLLFRCFKNIIFLEEQVVSLKVE